MPVMNLKDDQEVRSYPVQELRAAGTSDVEMTEVDMQNYEGVFLCCKFGAITASAVTSVKAQQDTVTGMGSAADLLGTGQTVADSDDDLWFVIHLVKPLERFVRMVVDRGTQNAVIEAAVAIKYRGKKAPITQGATIGGIETHVSPSEGTA